MSPVPRCCNPLLKSKHKVIQKNLKCVTKDWKTVFSSLIGLYICDTCRIDINKKGLKIKKTFPIESENNKVQNELVITEEESDQDKKDPTFQFKKLDQGLKMGKVKLQDRENSTTERNVKRQRKSFENNVEETAVPNVLKKTRKPKPKIINEQLICDVNGALLRAKNYNEKIEIVTTLPIELSIRQMRTHFKVSHRMASRAKKLRKTDGYKSCPKKKKGKKMNPEIVNKVIAFYLSEEASRMMPGKKDCITIPTKTGRKNVQKQLLLHDLKDLHSSFKTKYPDNKISLSMFTKLRPKECILANKNGCHNVCVCKTHQNMKLKFEGLKSEFKKRQYDFITSCKDALNEIICQDPSSSCYLLTCKKCPGSKAFCEKLQKLFSDYSITEVKYNEWTSTDRCEIQLQNVCVEQFLRKLKEDLKTLLKHDFIAKSQGVYFSNLKHKLEDEEFLVSLDFAENYTFCIQDAIQSYHWASPQATLHPYVIYYKKNNILYNHSFVIISENEKHNAAAVHLFNKRLITYLRDKHGKESVKKIIYFSDGAASQYKNKSNFVNLLFHEKDFNAVAEWHFFATSHGKGACDGIGGAVKRSAHKSSLQRPHGNQITSPKLLYNWAKTFFKKIDFDFCTRKDHEDEEKFLNKRFQKAVTIKQTRQYHCFYVKDEKSLYCKLFSDDSHAEEHFIVK